MMKGKMMKKLKSMKPIEYLKAEKILQVSNFDNFVENSIKPLKFPNFKDLDSKRRAWSKKNANANDLIPEVEVESVKIEVPKSDKIISEDELIVSEEDKENIRPSISNQQNMEAETSFHPPLSEIDIYSFRRPDMNSVTLFDPGLLALFRETVMQYMKAQKEDQLKSQNIKTGKKSEEEDEPEQGFSLSDFEEKCPPGGAYSVILYTTSLRGIRKTFEDCHSVRFLLESFRVVFQERDISIHSEFREELWRTIGDKCLPPRLFVMGRCIGGAEKVLTLHEQGRLKPLFVGVPRNQRDGPCEGCGGFRFVVCFNCSGSTRVFDCDEEEEDGLLSRSRCPECNENGLIVCPYCC